MGITLVIHLTAAPTLLISKKLLDVEGLADPVSTMELCLQPDTPISCKNIFTGPEPT
jgi:hypothetical protein